MFSYPQTYQASALGYQTNNRFQTFPPLMNDGRSILSTWQPESAANDQIIRENNIQSNWQYRRYIQKNADSILKQNQIDAYNDTGYIVRKVNPPSTNGGAKQYASLYEISPTEQESDLKQLYLSRERLESRKIAPEMTQSELLEKYGVKIKK